MCYVLQSFPWNDCCIYIMNDYVLKCCLQIFWSELVDAQIHSFLFTAAFKVTSRNDESGKAAKSGKWFCSAWLTVIIRFSWWKAVCVWKTVWFCLIHHGVAQAYLWKLLVKKVNFNIAFCICNSIVYASAF